MIRLPIDPMLAMKADSPMDGSSPILRRKDLAFEPKWDGYRMVVEVDGYGDVRLWSRSKRLVTNEYPEIVAEFVGSTPGTVYDGEVVVLDPDRGRFTFNALQNRMRLSMPARLERVRFVAFDLLCYDDVDLMRVPYQNRRAMLAQVGDLFDRAMVSPMSTDGVELWQHVVMNNGEGVIAKPLNSPYRQKERGTWLKLKTLMREQLVIVGWLTGESQGGPTPFGALVVAREVDGRLKYAGKVGTGFTTETEADLMSRLRPLEVQMPPWRAMELKLAISAIAPAQRDMHWVSPELSGWVEFADRSDDGIPRFPAWKGLSY